jgi:hypothetical protein
MLLQAEKRSNKRSRFAKKDANPTMDFQSLESGTANLNRLRGFDLRSARNTAGVGTLRVEGARPFNEVV